MAIEWKGDARDPYQGQRLTEEDLRALQQPVGDVSPEWTREFMAPLDEVADFGPEEYQRTSALLKETVHPPPPAHWKRFRATWFGTPPSGLRGDWTVGAPPCRKCGVAARPCECDPQTPAPWRAR